MFWSVRRNDVPSSSALAQRGLRASSERFSFSPASTEIIASMMLLSGVRSSRDIFSMKSFLSFSILPSFSLLRSSSMSWAKSASESFRISSLFSLFAPRRAAPSSSRARRRARASWAWSMRIATERARSWRSLLHRIGERGGRAHERARRARAPRSRAGRSRDRPRRAGRVEDGAATQRSSSASHRLAHRGPERSRRPRARRPARRSRRRRAAAERASAGRAPGAARTRARSPGRRARTPARAALRSDGGELLVAGGGRRVRIGAATSRTARPSRARTATCPSRRRRRARSPTSPSSASLVWKSVGFRPRRARSRREILFARSRSSRCWSKVCILSLRARAM